MDHFVVVLDSVDTMTFLHLLGYMIESEPEVPIMSSLGPLMLAMAWKKNEEVGISFSQITDPSKGFNSIIMGKKDIEILEDVQKEAYQNQAARSTDS